MKKQFIYLCFLTCLVFVGCKSCYSFDLSSVIVFPVDGILGDSYYPRDSGVANAPAPRNKFTVVWGGKYNGNWDKRGKGTGFHPGADIVNVGDNAYSIARGIVVYSKDNDYYKDGVLQIRGWGGVVVIEHDLELFENGSSSRQKYYSVYAHLKARSVAKDHIVTAGQKIGLIGGRYSDQHHGNSTGTHLHFQIDVREKIVGEDFEFPPHFNGIKSENGTELYDSDLPQKTKDPILLIESSYSYHPGKFYDGWHFLTYPISPFYEPLSEPFVQFMANSAGMAGLGIPITHVEECSGLFGVECNTWQSVNYSVWAQGFQNVPSMGDNPSGYLVANPHVYNEKLGYEGIVFPIHGQFKNYWRVHYCELGPPASNEFNCDGSEEVVVQWFEPTLGNYVAVGYWTTTGVFQTSNEISHSCFDPRYRIEDQNENMGCPADGCGVGGGGDIYDPPSSSFVVDVTTGEAPLIVNFYNTATSSNGEIVGFEWNFDDGSTSYMENPVHTFSEAGDYNVSLTVVDEVEEMDMYTMRISVTACSTCGPCDNIGTISSMTGDLLQANNYNIVSQNNIKLAKLNSTNKIVAVWESSLQDGSKDSVVTRLIDLDTGVIEFERIVNTFTVDNQRNPQVLATIDGYLVIWESNLQDGDKTGVFCQFFDNDAKKIGSEFQVNSYTDSYQKEISLAGNLNYDNIIIVWDSNNQDGDDEGIYAQLYNQNTKEKVGGEFRINATTVSDQEEPSVVINPNNGNFFIVWNYYINNDERNIVLQEIDQNGNKVGGEVTVVSNGDYKSDSQIAITDSNEIVVTWKASQVSTNYGPYDVFAQVLNINTKARVGDSLQVNTCSDIKVLDYELKAIPGGDDFIVTYSSQDTYSGQNDIYYQKFDVDGGAYGNIVKVSDVVGNQKFPGIIFL